MEEEKGTIRRLKVLPPLFRKQDTEKLTGYSGVFLSRAVKKGLIHRLNRGNYINSFLHGFPSVEEVACFLRPPAYISCEWALNYHGISLQSPTVCTVVTLSTSVGRKRNIQYQGVTCEFSKISPSLFFGFEYHKNFHMASPEKAILDTLYYRGNIVAQDELDLENVDPAEITKMAESYPRKVMRVLLGLNLKDAMATVV